MTGFLCALGIVGSMAFSIGWNSDEQDPARWPLVAGGGFVMLVAGFCGLIRLFV